MKLQRGTRFITLRKLHLLPVGLEVTDNTNKTRMYSTNIIVLFHNSLWLYLTQKDGKENNQLNEPFLVKTTQALILHAVCQKKS